MQKKKKTNSKEIHFERKNDHMLMKQGKRTLADLRKTDNGFAFEDNITHTSSMYCNLQPDECTSLAKLLFSIVRDKLKEREKNGQRKRRRTARSAH